MFVLGVKVQYMIMLIIQDFQQKHQAELTKVKELHNKDLEALHQTLMQKEDELRQKEDELRQQEIALNDFKKKCEELAATLVRNDLCCTAVIK